MSPNHRRNLLPGVPIRRRLQSYQKEEGKNTSDVFKDIATNIVGATAVSYVFGFIIVKTYLANLNINTLELIGPRYISTGLLFLLITLYHSLIGYLIYKLSYKQVNSFFDLLSELPSLALKKERQYPGEHQIVPENTQKIANSHSSSSDLKESFIYLFYLLLLIISLPLALNLATRDLYLYAASYFPFNIIWLSLFMAINSFLIFGIVDAYGKVKLKAFLFICIVMIVLLSYQTTELYSNTLFPLIPQSLGGGRAAQVTLFLKNKEEMSFLNQDGMRASFMPESLHPEPLQTQPSFSIKGGISIPVCLIEQTEKSYFVAYLIGEKVGNVISTPIPKNCVVSPYSIFSDDNNKVQKTLVIKQISRDVIAGVNYSNQRNILDDGEQK